MKTFIVPDEIFKTEILFVVGCSHKKFFQHLKKEYDVETDKQEVDSFIGTTGTTFKLEGEFNFRVVWIRHPKHVGTAVHEITHMVLRILDDKGIPSNVKDNQDETVAYLMDFYTRYYFQNVKLLKDQKNSQLKIY